MKKIIYIAFLLLAIACGKESSIDPVNPPIPNPDPPTPPVESEGKISEKTKVADASFREALQQIDLEDYTFTLKGNTDLKVNDILVDSVSEKAPNGYLRRIVEIQKDGDKTILKTEQARFTDAVLSGKIKYRSGKLQRSQVANAEFVDGVELVKESVQTRGKFTVFNIKFDKELESEDGNVRGKVKVKGEANVDLEFIFESEWSFNETLVPPVQVDLFKTGIGIHQAADINIEGEATAGFNKTFTLGSIYFTPITIMVGTVPLVFSPEIDLILTAEGKIHGEVKMKAGESYDGELGVQYTNDDGWEGLGKSDFKKYFETPSLDAKAKFAVGVGPRAGLKLYGLAGLTAGLMAKAELNAHIQTKPDKWDLNMQIGLCATAGAEVDLLFKEVSFSTNIFCKKKELFRLNNEPIGNGIAITYPNRDRKYPHKKKLKITTMVSGETPSEVHFFIDGKKVATDSDAPFEYLWETENESVGQHVLQLKAVMEGKEIASKEVPLELFVSHWEKIDLSPYIDTSKEYWIRDIHFVTPEHGYVYGLTRGKEGRWELETTDGGKTWNIQKDAGGPDMVTWHDRMTYLGQGAGLYYENGNLVLDNDNEPFSLEKNINIFGIGGLPNRVLDAHGLGVGSNGNLFSIGTFGDYTVTDSITRLMEVKHDRGYNYIVRNIPLEKGTDYGGDIYMNHDVGIVYNLGRDTKDNLDYRPEYLLSHDGGRTWKRKYLTATGITQSDLILDACFINANEGWLVGLGRNRSDGFFGEETNEPPYVLKTIDGGETWQRIDVPNVPQKVKEFYQIRFINSEVGFATTTEFFLFKDGISTVYKTIDGGLTWEPMEEFRNVEDENEENLFSITDMEFPNEDTGLAGGMNCLYRFVGGRQ